MNTSPQPKNPQAKHKIAVIQREINGAMHTFLPAVFLTPGLLRFEEALGKAVTMLKKSPQQAMVAKRLFLNTIRLTYASQRPQPKKLAGKTQYWPLRKGNSLEDHPSPFEADLLSTQLSNVINAPYIEAGKALLRAFRLLTPAAPASFETLAAFINRKWLFTQFETERRRTFDAYLKSCESIMQITDFPSDFKATFERFQAAWLNAPLQAQAGFIFNTSASNQRRDTQTKHKYALITSEVNGRTHSFLPATYITPKIFNFEKSLNKVVSSLAMASREATALRKQMSRHIGYAIRDRYRLTFTNAGSPQFWILAQGVVSASKAKQMRTFNGMSFERITTTEYERNVGPMAEDMTRQEAKLFLAAGQCMAETFRLLEAATCSTLGYLSIFMCENKLPFILQSERSATFSAYIKNCKKDLVKPYGSADCEREAVIATFDRFTALWLSLPAPAKSAFVLAL
jgi:hypothetical protein